MSSILRVLYIEDDEGVARLLHLHLTSRGWSVELAHDGETALELCRLNDYDAILIDYSLPDLNGLEILKQLHQIYEHLPAIIIVTGTGDEHIAVEAMKSGADDYIVKDVTRHYLDLLPQVIERTLETHDLRRQQQELQLDQARLIEELRAFGYAVAHDLKQPLAHLVTSSDLLERYIDSQNLQGSKRKLHQMRAAFMSMSETIDALLLFARIRETINVEFEPVNMTELVHKVIQQLEDAIAVSHAVVETAEELPSAWGYVPWIERIWVNYLSNALKYGGKPPRIEIGATHQPHNKIRYWVKDNGEGLTTSEQGMLFTPFTRLKAHETEGHGLGLAIVNLIAYRLGGEATVLSTPGEGSMFSFTLNACDTSNNVGE